MHALVGSPLALYELIVLENSTYSPSHITEISSRTPKLRSLRMQVVHWMHDVGTVTRAATHAERSWFVRRSYRRSDFLIRNRNMLDRQRCLNKQTLSSGQLHCTLTCTTVVRSLLVDVMSDSDQILCFTLARAMAARGSGKFSGCSVPETPCLFLRSFRTRVRPVRATVSE